MGIITLPIGYIEKGTVYPLTLDKTLLAALVTGDSYFSNPLNWKFIKLFYTSIHSDQKEIVVFDATSEPTVGNFSVSTRARSVFRISKIVIFDFDYGTHTLLAGIDFSESQFGMGWDLKTPAVGQIVSKMTNRIFTLTDSTFFQIGYRVRLFNTQTGNFEGGTQVIQNIVGDTIYLNSIFSVSLNVNVHILRFAPFEECSSDQQINYYFVV